MTFSGRFLLGMIQYAVTSGADMNNLVAMTGYEFEELCDEKMRVDSLVYNRVIEACVQMTGDDYFGLHAGEYLNLSAAGLIGQITQTAPTVKEALQYCCDFASLGCRALPMELVKLNGCYQLSFIPDKVWKEQSPQAVRHTIEGTLAFFLREFHLLTLQTYYPEEIGLGYQPNHFMTELERVFKCPVVTGQDTTYMVFNREHVEAAVVTSDYQLLRILVKFAEEKVKTLVDQEGYFHRTRKYVMNMLSPGFPLIEAVAGNMNISARTLQRKLKTEGYTYKDVIESLRKELAFSYMKRKDLTLKEVADLLDYADASAFTRSFKNWTGQTPGQYMATKKAHSDKQAL